MAIRSLTSFLWEFAEIVSPDQIQTDLNREVFVEMLFFICGKEKSAYFAPPATIEVFRKARATTRVRGENL